VIVVDPDGKHRLAADDLIFPNGSVITADGRTLIVGEGMRGAYTAFPCIWATDVNNARVVRVREGGEIAALPGQIIFACVLGGEDGRTLLLCVAAGVVDNDRLGDLGATLQTVRVDVPGAGRP
jgi:sugar lactone lactonase YvrE